MTPSQMRKLDSELREYIENWAADRGSVSRRYSAPLSKLRRERLQRLHEDWLGRLRRLDFAALPRDAQIDWLLLDNHLVAHGRNPFSGPRRVLVAMGEPCGAG